MQSPSVTCASPDQLVSRRTFIFARAGFGKSNLNKLLFSKLYEDTHRREARRTGRLPVGTVIFDPDGEYFWPDDKGRPGLCDVPTLQDKLVVFTPRRAPSPFYQSFVAGGIKLDIRRLRPADVIAIALSPERQDQQNVRKLRGFSPDDWRRLVDLIDTHGNEPTSKRYRGGCCNSTPTGADARRSPPGQHDAIVRMLHDPSQPDDGPAAARR